MVVEVLFGITLTTFVMVAVPRPQPSRVVVWTSGPRRTPYKGEKS
jgi:hypothetical protein